MLDRLPVATVRLLLGGRFWTAVLIGATVLLLSWGWERLTTAHGRTLLSDGGLVASVAAVAVLWISGTLRSAWLIGGMASLGIVSRLVSRPRADAAAGAVVGAMASRADSVTLDRVPLGLVATFAAVPAATAATARRWRGRVPFGWLMLVSSGGILVISPEPDAAVSALGAMMPALALRARNVGPTGIAVWSIVSLWVLGVGAGGRATALTGGVAAFAWLLTGWIRSPRWHLGTPGLFAAHTVAAWWGARVAGLQDSVGRSVAVACAGLALIALVGPTAWRSGDRPSRDAPPPRSV